MHEWELGPWYIQALIWLAFNRTICDLGLDDCYG